MEQHEYTVFIQLYKTKISGLVKVLLNVIWKYWIIDQMLENLDKDNNNINEKSENILEHQRSFKINMTFKMDIECYNV